MKNNILWIRNDLRFEDNTALIMAVESTCSVDESKENTKLTIVFHINTEQVKIGTFSNDYFFSAFNVFYEKVKALGGDILFLYGNPEQAFQELFDEHSDIKEVFFNASERGYGLQRDKKVIEIIRRNNADVSCFLDKHLHGADKILNGKGKQYKVFTAYYRKWSSLQKRGILKFDYDKFKRVINKDFYNRHKSQYDNIIESLKYDFESDCGEDIALTKLYGFIDENLIDYEDNRDDPFLNSNSSMSKYLSTGQISIRKVYHLALEEGYAKSIECFIRQLAWRDFYNMVYHHNPKQAGEEIIEKYRGINWNHDIYAFYIWKYGLTGYPIVDSAMRELMRTGEMHNRLRMITASFLVKDLLVDWRMGEEYFKDMLIDYDSASNIGSWQWIASTGTDACPYFRIFNPNTQSKRFDDKARYIKSVLNELLDVEERYIHKPYKMSDFNVDYPKPIVEHNEQRLKALGMYRAQCAYKSNFKNEFIKRYILFEFQKIKEAGKKALVEFHSDNKYLYFTYSIELKDKLGRLLAQKMEYEQLYREYKTVLCELLDKIPNIGKTINAYEHMYGYFKDLVDSHEKSEYKRLITKYREVAEIDDRALKEFFIELIDKYDVPYIKRQTLLFKHK